MESQALKELVRKIFNDEKIKSQFMANPNSVLATFSLTEDEKKAVLKTHGRLGQMFSNSTHLEATIEPDAFWP
jgi:hypothetical protein